MSTIGAKVQWMPWARASRAATDCAACDDLRVPRGSERDRHGEDGAHSVDDVEAEDQRDAEAALLDGQALDAVRAGRVTHKQN